jgi:hypothetical protein
LTLGICALIASGLILTLGSAGARASHPSAETILGRSARAFARLNTYGTRSTTRSECGCHHAHPRRYIVTSVVDQITAPVRESKERDWYLDLNTKRGVAYSVISVASLGGRSASRLGGQRWICSSAGRALLRRKLPRWLYDETFSWGLALAPTPTYVGAGILRGIPVWKIRVSGPSFSTTYWVSRRDYTMRHIVDTSKTHERHFGVVRSQSWTRISDYGAPISISLPRVCRG